MPTPPLTHGGPVPTNPHIHPSLDDLARDRRRQIIDQRRAAHNLAVAQGRCCCPVHGTADDTQDR